MADRSGGRVSSRAVFDCVVVATVIRFWKLSSRVEEDLERGSDWG